MKDSGKVVMADEMNGRIEDRLSKGVQSMSSAGLMVPPPKRTCDDTRCPFHGHVKVQREDGHGRVVSISDKQTVVIQREFLFKIPKYNRYERRRGKVHAHLPPCIEVKEGGCGHDSRVQAACEDDLVRRGPGEERGVGCLPSRERSPQRA